MERLGRGDRLRRSLIKNGEDAERILEGRREKPEEEKNKQKVCGAPWGMRQKEIEKSKRGRRCREKTECKRAPTKTTSPGGDEGLGNKSGGAAARRDRQPRSGNGERIAGAEKSKRIGENMQ